LTRQGIRTPRDGNWVAGMVLRILGGRVMDRQLKQTAQ
jgi:hypothetical protein